MRVLFPSNKQRTIGCGNQPSTPTVRSRSIPNPHALLLLDPLPSPATKEGLRESNYQTLHPLHFTSQIPYLTLQNLLLLLLSFKFFMHFTSLRRRDNTKILMNEDTLLEYTCV